MKISRTIEATIGYLAEAMATIFSPVAKAPPIVGIQPYTGEIYHDRF